MAQTAALEQLTWGRIGRGTCLQFSFVRLASSLMLCDTDRRQTKTLSVQFGSFRCKKDKKKKQAMFLAAFVIG